MVNTRPTPKPKVVGRAFGGTLPSDSEPTGEAWEPIRDKPWFWRPRTLGFGFLASLHRFDLGEATLVAFFASEFGGEEGPGQILR
jgi:hypothetical protein